MPHPGMPTDLPADFFAAIAVLNAKQRLEIDDMKLMILLETAGEPLYAMLAERIGNDAAADLLRLNGREETAHAHRLKKAIEILTGAPFEIPPLSENPYATPPKIGALTPEVLAALRQGEADGDASYRRYADAEQNGEVAALLRQNGREELRHGERVARVIELLAQR